MRIGVSSYSFSRLVCEKRMTPLDIVKKTREMGFDAIEFAGLDVPAGETVASVAASIKDACSQAGLPIACYMIGADFLRDGANKWQAEVERLRSEVKIADALGVTAMRHDGTGGFPALHRGARGFEDALPFLARGCRAVTEFAADLGIRTMVENHGFSARTASALRS